MLKNDLSADLMLSIIESEENTLEFIAGIKWGEGFVCRSCGNTNYCSGKRPHSRRCTRCKIEESATAHTIFHNCKFPINKAFQIAYQICVEHKKVPVNVLADTLGINPMTGWRFRSKIETCIARQKASEGGALSSILLNE